MSTAGRQLRVWLFDRRERWRALYAQALEETGFAVLALDSYSYPFGAAGPDLVILACPAVTSAERRLVKSASQKGYRILVLAAALPTHVMRELFLAGAHDVTTTPVSPGELVNLVQHTFQELENASGEKALLMAGVR